MNKSTLLALLEQARENAIDESRKQRTKGNEIEAQFQLGRQAAFLTASNLVRRLANLS